MQEKFTESLCILDVICAEASGRGTGFHNCHNIRICVVSAFGIKGILLHYCNSCTNVNDKNFLVIITEYFLCSIMFILIIFLILTFKHCLSYGFQASRLVNKNIQCQDV